MYYIISYVYVQVYIRVYVHWLHTSVTLSYRRHVASRYIDGSQVGVPASIMSRNTKKVGKIQNLFVLFPTKAEKVQRN